MSDERQMQDAECELRLEVMRLGEEEWPVNPAVSDFCALRLNEGIALVYEVKNAFGDCRDREPGAPPSRKCSTCKHLRRGPGDSKDAARLQEIRTLGQAMAASGQGGDPGLQEWAANRAARRAFEAGVAYNFGKCGPNVPDYLPTCARYSSAEEHVFCAMQNPHDRCAGWESNTEPKPKYVPGKLVAAAGSGS